MTEYQETGGRDGCCPQCGQRLPERRTWVIETLPATTYPLTERGGTESWVHDLLSAVGAGAGGAKTGG